MSGPGKVDRPFVFPVENLTLSTEWWLGPVVLEPPGHVLELLKRSPARRSRGWARKALVGRAITEAERIKDLATATITSDDQDGAFEVAAAVMGVLRLYQRTRHRMVELRGQTFGLPGELYQVSRKAVVLGKSPTVHAKHLGNVGKWEFTDDDREAFELDARFQYLVKAAVTPPAHQRASQRRALLSLELIDAAWLSPDPRLHTLYLAIAVEVLLGRTDEEGETLRIARRAAYLTCPARCGRQDTPACRYLYPFVNRQHVAAFIKSRRARGEHGLCSAFLDISETLFGERNRIVHEGAVPAAGARGPVRYWDVEQVYLDAVGWFAAQPSATMRGLDGEIQRLLVTGSPLWV